MQSPAIVWFKRDLRITDHGPLEAAASTGRPVILLYIFEPQLFNKPPYDQRHRNFVASSLQAMQNQLAGLNKHLVLYAIEGTALEILNSLHQITHFNSMYSHEETGTAYTYHRDKQITHWCKASGIQWIEFPSNGVIRPCKNRKDWQKNWDNRMNLPQYAPNIAAIIPYEPSAKFGLFIQHFRWDYQPYKQQPNHQPAGELFAHKYLNSFLKERHVNYSAHISKPEASRRSCSRLSVYLAWGNLSIRQVYQSMQQAKASSPNKKALHAFASRLMWHCHFIQKFETECRMEFEPLNRAFNSIRTHWNERYYLAWQNAKTGYPLVDACMRCVQETAYLNFRMRAMLVSFLTHHLWLDWKRGADYLGSQFLDFEPGIHYAQFQMQVGLMGINTIRVYNPVKQSTEHDSEGIFIRKWLPELALVPTPLIHEPWKMTSLEQILYGCRIGIDYPAPVIELTETGTKARQELWKLKQSKAAQVENKTILKRHVKSRLRKFKESHLPMNRKSVDT
jgi:deoxyribodipyrimidine photo-lyase